MKFPPSKQLFSDLKKGTLHKCYLLLGDEEGDKDKVIEKIQSLLFTDEEERRSSTARFFPQGTFNSDFRDGVDFALAPSMFSTRRLCIIKNINQVPVNNVNKMLARDMVEEGNSTVTIIMTSPEKKIPSLFPKELHERLSVYQFWRYFDSDLARYVERTMGEHGMTCERGVIKELLERTGNDIKKIDEAVMMLASFEQQSISVDDVLFAVADVSEASVFEYVDALFFKKKAAMKLLHKLVNDYTPELMVLSLINRQALLLEQCFMKTDQGESLHRAVSSLKLPSKAADKTVAMAQGLNKEKLKHLFILLAEAESSLKSGSSSGFISNPLTLLTENFLTSH